MTKNYLKFRSRILLIISLILFSWIGLSIRLFQVQVINGAKYRELGFKQAQAQMPLPALRGNIYDHNSKPLTRNIIKYSFATYPAKVSSKNKLANKLSDYFGRSSKYYKEKLEKNKNFTYLERNLSKKESEFLLEDLPEGLIVERDSRRFYPNGNIASQLIGYTDPDNFGLTGIEKQFNDYLTGSSGWVVRQISEKGMLYLIIDFLQKHQLMGTMSNLLLILIIKWFYKKNYIEELMKQKQALQWGF